MNPFVLRASSVIAASDAETAFAYVKSLGLEPDSSGHQEKTDYSYQVDLQDNFTDALAILTKRLGQPKRLGGAYTWRVKGGTVDLYELEKSSGKAFIELANIPGLK